MIRIVMSKWNGHESIGGDSGMALTRMLCSFISMLMILGLLIVTAGQARAGCSASPFWASEVVVVTVIETPSGEWTFGAPPQISVEVVDVLAGKTRKGRLTVVWGPAPHDIDTGGREKELEAWRSRRMEPPKPGTKWILWGEAIGDHLMTTRADGRLVWSEKNFGAAREMISQRQGGKTRSELEKKSTLPSNAPDPSFPADPK